ncbi:MULTISPECIES: hypothetical protein [unclassified Bradyrhizobium]|uniref:hypothetical protein n=1 Tax=unclassified Bradyrhizobium TaxID=2631580 RepID=UPI001FF65E0A|nr:MULTISPECIES: hypothetical protein [unclassified Bradyrhizobium]MCJ9700053.1 hypothetical protein [Bradyrhizobium sp. SHOUNA76]MCJ9729097.1 hypothetical protein [Bradyrhizobium sp. PRIMUS42]
MPGLDGLSRRPSYLNRLVDQVANNLMAVSGDADALAVFEQTTNHVRPGEGLPGTGGPWIGSTPPASAGVIRSAPSRVLSCSICIRSIRILISRATFNARRLSSAVDQNETSTEFPNARQAEFSNAPEIPS